MTKHQKETASYTYCHICGFEPHDNADPCNFVRKYWDADDGWKIGALCIGCWQDVKNDEPKPGDYAYDTSNEWNLDNIDTDIDPLLVL